MNLTFPLCIFPTAHQLRCSILVWSKEVSSPTRLRHQQRKHSLHFKLLVKLRLRILHLKGLVAHALVSVVDKTQIIYLLSCDELRGQ